MNEQNSMKGMCLIIVDELVVTDDPRIRNIILALQKYFEFTTLALGKFPNIRSYEISKVPARNWHFRLPPPIKQLVSIYFRILQFFEALNPHFKFKNRVVALVKQQPEIPFEALNLIMCAHPWNMPIALHYKKKYQCAVVLDLYEYYPGQFPDSRFVNNTAPYYDYLLRTYSKNADLILVAAQGFQQKYQLNYGIKSLFFPGASPYFKQDASSKRLEPNQIRLVHHGIANRSRKIEDMISAVGRLPNNFTTHFYLMKSDGAPEYLDELKEFTIKFENVDILDPVPMELIVPTISKYDVGIYLLPPESENQKLLLPHKIFEFVQARLFCVTGPSVGFSGIVSDYDIGIVSKDFSADSFFEALMEVNENNIMEKRKNLEYAAKDLCIENYFSDLRTAVQTISLNI